MGGTEILAPLEHAFALPPARGAVGKSRIQRSVFLLTDGQVRPAPPLAVATEPRAPGWQPRASRRPADPQTMGHGYLA